ncbi:MAG: glutamine synthetase, partial [Pikeienuella sp.]
MTDADQLAAFQAANPDIEIIEMVWPDMNGVMRGKWLPASEAGKLIKGDARIPASTYALDIFSEDTDGPGMAAEQGDPDAKTIPLMHT